ncbi:MAG TPA: cytochrome c oxidase subunit 3 family protein [Polyangiaceae bacterium]|nr:cytochrome c oxidase subunit 3 family protein [Polyangiaceae bacterium]
MSEPSTAPEAAKTASAPPPAPHDHGHDDAGHGHGEHDPIHAANPHLAHHFDTPQQQFDAGKLGIWLFLLTEVLFFAGLFCAYTVYRAMHPEVFVYAHYFLDTKLGALNTCVLLISSLTAAWAVRNAQLAEKKALMLNIVITIACACTFMCVKYVEYAHKYHDGLLPGHNFQPKEQIWELKSFRDRHPEAAEYAEKLSKLDEKKAEPVAAKGEAGKGEKLEKIERPTEEELEPLLAAGLVGPRSLDPSAHISRPRMAHVFFGIYFFMTGLHGFHVLIGIGIWIWMLVKAAKNQFGANYFGPIDFTALYWHLVDLIWIYLFPLLYLIH